MKNGPTITLRGTHIDDGLAWGVEWEDVQSWDDVLSATATLVYITLHKSRPDKDDPCYILDLIAKVLDHVESMTERPKLDVL